MYSQVVVFRATSARGKDDLCSPSMMSSVLPLRCSCNSCMNYSLHIPDDRDNEHYQDKRANGKEYACPLYQTLLVGDQLLQRFGHHTGSIAMPGVAAGT